MIYDVIHAIFGLAMGLIIPGTVLAFVLFKKFDAFDKFSIGIGLSICIDIILGFILGNHAIGGAYGGLTESNVWIFLSLITIEFLVLGYFLKSFDNIVEVSKRLPNLRLNKNIVIIFSLLILVFSTRFFLYSGNPYAGDAYEFKSLYITNQLITTGYINENIPLNDESYKFYTGMIIDDTLHNKGHPIFLAIIQLLTKVPLEILRRFSIITVLLVFPLFSLYRLFTKSSKYAPVYVLLALLYFESCLVITGKTANVTLAWYLTVCAIYLLSSDKYRLRTSILTLVFQIILLFTYKTSAISLIPLLIVISYGKTIISSFAGKEGTNLVSYFRLNLIEILNTSLIFITSMIYYFFFYPLIIRVFLERVITPLDDSSLKIISVLVISITLISNLLIFICIYYSLLLIRKYKMKLRRLVLFIIRIRKYLVILFTFLLVLVTYLYLNGLQTNSFLITPSTDNQLVIRIATLFIFMELFCIALLYSRELLSKGLNSLIYYWILGSLVVFPIWFIWGGIYGFILRVVVVMIFPGSLIVANLMQNILSSRLKNKVLLPILIACLIFPTIYYMETISILGKGAINFPEYYGIKWISQNIDNNKVIYSDLRIAGAIPPISNYTHIQLKGPNDFNGNNPYEGTNLSEELNNIWYTDTINPTTNKVFTYRNINYFIQSSNYYSEGIMASNFFYKTMNNNTREAFDESIFFDTPYNNGKLWIYEIR